MSLLFAKRFFDFAASWLYVLSERFLWILYKKEAWKCTLLCVVMLITSVSPSHFNEAGHLDLQQADVLVKKLEADLMKVSDDSLAVTAMQDYLNSLDFQALNLNGPDVVHKLANSLNKKFQEKLEALENLKEAIEKSYKLDAGLEFEAENVLPRCCDLDTSYFEEDPRFKTKVDMETACIQVSIDGPDDVRLKHLHNAVIEQMKSNIHRIPTLKWQFYGDENGMSTTYPAHAVPSCGTFDPRFRPWYVTALTPEPKDVVVVIDSSGSMRTQHAGKPLMKLAKFAASTVLGSLGQSDRVGFVAFSTTARVPVGTHAATSCYGRELALATQANIGFLNSYIESLVPHGTTYYTSALEKAFSLLNNSNLEEDFIREKVILFLTDGLPTDSAKQIMTTLFDLNKQLDNQVILVTYGLGEAAKSHGAAILTSMALQNGERYGASPPENDIKPGKFVSISNPDDLRKAMGLYYQLFISNTAQSFLPRLSAPYVDVNGLGVVTTLSVPVMFRGKARGVVGVDLSLSELLSDVVFFPRGVLSYPFIIDSRGYAVLHPLLPSPIGAYDSPIYVDIIEFERDPRFLKVRDKMLQGTSGSHSVLASNVKSLGETLLEGVSIASFPATFHWAPIADIGYSVCLVVATADTNFVLPHLTHQNPVFLYHRLDLLPNELEDIGCHYYNRVATKDKSTVKFAASAFTDEFSYLEAPEKEAVIRRYTHYMNDKTGLVQNPGFKDGVRDEVIFTSKVNDYWTASEAFSAKIAWRYIGTYKGVFRILPGVVLDKPYDPVIRPWFKRSVSRPEKLTISTPYEDANGAGYVITLSKALKQSKGRHGGILAVMGADYTLANFFEHVFKGICEVQTGSDISCFVIDDSGFLVAHPDFWNEKTGCSAAVENVHITGKVNLFPITYELIKKGYLKREACTNFQTFSYQYYWRLYIHKAVQLETDCFSSYFQPVHNTNVYIAVVLWKHSDGCLPQTSCSACDLQQTPKCNYTELDACECPCVSPTRYKYCEDDFVLLSDDWPTCVPDPPTYQTGFEGMQVDHLRECFPSLCYSYITELDCISFGCEWLCDIGTCVAADTCRPRYSCSSQSSSSKNLKLAYIGFPIVVVAVLAITIAIVVKWKGRSKEAAQNLANEQQTAISVMYSNESNQQYDNRAVDFLHESDNVRHTSLQPPIYDSKTYDWLRPPPYAP